MEKFLIHQGDVLLMSADIPATAQEIETNGTIVLAHGETTGHSHHILGRGAVMFRDDGGGSYVRVNEPKTLEHGTIGIPNTSDHDALPLAPGGYETRRQVEWSDAQEPRVVAD